MKRLKTMQDHLINVVHSQISNNLATVDTKELGEAVDMIKDLAETMYYCAVVKAMEEAEEEKRAPLHADPSFRDGAFGPCSKSSHGHHARKPGYDRGGVDDWHTGVMVAEEHVRMEHEHAN